MTRDILREHLAWLGHKVKDSVTGFEGVVSSVSFDLYGCVQAIVVPGHNKKEGKTPDAYWFDVKRLERVSSKPVMEVPEFAAPVGFEKGPAAKPPQRSNPVR